MKKLLLGISITFTLLVTVGCGSNNVTTEDLKAHDWIAKTDGEDPDMTMTFSDHVIKIGIDTSSLKSTSTNEWEKIGEDFAANLLELQGYRILERNFRCRMGEIDLIAEKDGEISFVEVKTRRSARFGMPAEAVGAEKQRRMRRTAEFYLKSHPKQQQTADFQVIEVFCNQIDYAF